MAVWVGSDLTAGRDLAKPILNVIGVICIICNRTWLLMKFSLNISKLCLQGQYCDMGCTKDMLIPEWGLMLVVLM